VGGQRAYRLARKGRAVELEAKPVQIDRLEVTGYEWPRLGLDIVCSSGTFVRAIGRDLAAALGTAAVMESLVRTTVGPFRREAALPLAAADPDAVKAALLPAAAAVAHLPRTMLDGDVLERAIRGGIISVPEAVVGDMAAVDVAGELVGILRPHGSGGHRLRPNFRGLG
jgi:tRNA pseudouridine55 synthase